MLCPSSDRRYVPDSEVAGRNNLVHFFSLGQCKLSVD
jgi:hypothetical protein